MRYILFLLLLLPTIIFAQDLDISGWTIQQQNSTQQFTLPGGTSVVPGGYVIIARDATQVDFESYYSVTLGPEVTYVNSAGTCPMINGDETYTLLNSGSGVEDGPTPGITATRQAYHRNDPEVMEWTVVNEIPTPGSGVEDPDQTLSNMIISEVNDPDSYVYEYVELYFDGTSGSSTMAPAIENTAHTPIAPEAGNDLIISTTVTDPDGFIEVVWCWYRIGGGSFVPRAMTTSGNDVYETTFLDMSGNTMFEYYIFARDNDNEEAFDPQSAPSTFYDVWIQGEYIPGSVVLFDHSHSQDAGSGGNWRVDNNYPDPVPATPSNESDWSGQLSTWGYELYLAGHTIRSTVGSITSGTLTDVDMLVIVEPQDPFTTSEITAIGEWVRTGGSLIFVSNHNASDRNSNGWDAPSILGGYSVPHIQDPIGGDVDTFCGGLFGLHQHVKDEPSNSITGTFTNTISDPSNPVIHGQSGDVNAVIFHVGGAMSLWPTANGYLSDVGALISKDSGSPHVATWSRYGDGKIVGFGDSSSTADGTGSESHNNNWTEAGSNNREFFLNASWWLLSGSAPSDVNDVPFNPGLNLQCSPNPFNPRTQISFTMPASGHASVQVLNLRGQLVRTLLDNSVDVGDYTLQWSGLDDNGQTVPSGVYLVRATGAGNINISKVVLAK
jgi:hypothetical protein